MKGEKERKKSEKGARRRERIGKERLTLVAHGESLEALRPGGGVEGAEVTLQRKSG
jgi:hypothetical protein